jgi:hypothetical protein
MWAQENDISYNVELDSGVSSGLSVVFVGGSNDMGVECIVQDAGRLAVPDGRLVMNV